MSVHIWCMIFMLFFQQIFIDIHYLLATVLGTRNTEVSKIDKMLCLCGISILWKGDIISKLAGKIQSHAVLWKHSLGKQLFRFYLCIRGRTGVKGLVGTLLLWAPAILSISIVNINGSELSTLFPPPTPEFKLLPGRTMFLLSLYLQC